MWPSPLPQRDSTITQMTLSVSTSGPKARPISSGPCCADKAPPRGEQRKPVPAHAALEDAGVGGVVAAKEEPQRERERDEG